MKKLILLVSALALVSLSGCATIAHKNVETVWSGYGFDLEYRSAVAINPDDIPAFIRAVDKLEKLLGGTNGI